MREHFQSRIPPMYPPTSQRKQLEEALAAAKKHMLMIPRANELAQRIQNKIIAGYEAQLAELTPGDWLK